MKRLTTYRSTSPYPQLRNPKISENRKLCMYMYWCVALFDTVYVRSSIECLKVCHPRCVESKYNV